MDLVGLDPSWQTFFEVRPKQTEVVGAGPRETQKRACYSWVYTSLTDKGRCSGKVSGEHG